MEPVLEVYCRPYDQRRPVICMDEQAKQLIDEVRMPVTVQPSGAAKEDFGVRAARRMRGAMRMSSGSCWCDQLNTPWLASLYEAFSAAEALPLARRLELVHTPRHGSWLNMAEPELSVLTRQCLGQRIGDIEQVRDLAQRWAAARNQRQTGIDWQFCTEQVRTKLKYLYPKMEERWTTSLDGLVRRPLMTIDNPL